MSSSPRADAGRSTRFRSPRSWSLRARLLASQIVLLALVCAAIGVGTELALQRFLTHQLDDRLAETGQPLHRAVRIRAAAATAGMGSMPGYPIPTIPDASSFATTSGRAPPSSTRPGRPPAPSVRWYRAARRSTPVSSPPTAPAPKSARPQRNNSPAIPPSHKPTTVELDGLGRYRVIAMHARGPGETIVTGLPTSEVDDTLVVGARHLLRGRRRSR